MSDTTTTAPAASDNAAPASNAPSEVIGPVLLHMAAEADSAAPATENGEPAKDFWGKGVKVGGRYVTTDRKTKKKVAFTVTPRMAEQMLSSWERMKDKGVRVPLVRDHSVTAADTLGRMVELKREGDWIKPRVRAVGDDAIRMAARNEISLGIKPDFQDGTGEKYDLAVWHVGLTPVPVVPDQGGLIAASRPADDDGSLVFSLETDPATPATPTERTGAPADARGTGSALDLSAAGTTEGAPATPAAARKDNAMLTPELQKKIRELTGAPEDAKDDVLLSRLVEEAEKQRTDVKKLATYGQTLKGENETLLSRAEEAEEAATAAEARSVELSRQTTEAAELTPREVLLSREGEGVFSERYMRLSEKADRLLSHGYAPTDVASLKSSLIGSEESVNVFNLSREDGSAPCAADAVLDVLLSMKPDAPKPGEALAVDANLSRGGEAPDTGPKLGEKNPWGIKKPKEKAAK